MFLKYMIYLHNSWMSPTIFHSHQILGCLHKVHTATKFLETSKNMQNHILLGGNIQLHSIIYFLETSKKVAPYNFCKTPPRICTPNNL